MRVAVIGGGAAGFFAAINTKIHHPNASVTLLEKSKKVLAKVKISGGGRCNVTTAIEHISNLCKAYPRGSKELKPLFKRFNNKHTIEWFESRGVLLKSEADLRMFPVSNRSQSIIDCLLGEINKLGIKVELGRSVSKVTHKVKHGHSNYQLHFNQTNTPPAHFDKLIIATGGSPKAQGFEWLKTLGHSISLPVPSLFTFNIKNPALNQLMGLSVKQAHIQIQGQKLKSEGPVLITHWGLSGPAILKLSAFGARVLNELDYKFNIQINWLNEHNQEKSAANLKVFLENNYQKQIGKTRPFAFPSRFWDYLLKRSQIDPQKKCGDIGKKGLNKLIQVLSYDIYNVNGKSTFKEEFVTCGGVELQNLDLTSMQSKHCPGMYFAGEVLDIDGITGGFNFQAAWTTAFIASQLK